MSTSEIAFRALHEDDFTLISQTLANWWDDWGDPGATAQRQLLLPPLFFQHFSDTSTAAVDATGEIVGYLVGFLSQSRVNESYIHFVGVHPNKQGQGLGATLYTRFFDLCVRRGVTKVSCVTSPGNTGSIGFHRAMGFDIVPGRLGPEGVDVQPNYDGPGLDRVCFTKSLRCL
ncbi:GNAT family N-acetyltransferase [Streptomyces sp. tea 10]|nr:GNAT family N-acetyltransferase [Streptomyces sp. tea 10]